MSTAELATRLLLTPGFRNRLESVTVDSVTRQFRALTTVRDGLFGEDLDWSYLLTCASLLSQSVDPACEDAAFRIAQHCLTISPLGPSRDAACVILDMLTNKPSIALAENRQLVVRGIERRLAMPLRLQWHRRELEATVWTQDGTSISLNRFQKDLWLIADAATCLSITAPTSAGKSYALRRWIGDFCSLLWTGLIIYIVPTRALIHQVLIDLRDELSERKVPAHLSSLPSGTAIQREKLNVFVLTQERLHHLLREMPQDVPISLAVVDEAHRVADGSRGILLQNVIDSMCKRSPHLKVLFASPLVSNPDVLLSLTTPTGVRRVLKSSHVTVNQNLLWVSQAPNDTQRWLVELCIGDSMRPLGHIALVHRPSPSSKRLTFVAHALSDPAGGNLIYSNGASDAEKTAYQLWDLLDEPTNLDTDIVGLIDVVKSTIHPRYILATTLSRGVAFHYGNIPQHVRVEVERLFGLNKIRYLVCTSTLIEGMNLPCRTIFIRGPRRGKGVAMSEADFWNLAGRAGRLGKEFQGNIVCIDPRMKNVWNSTPPTKRSIYPIRLAGDSVLDHLDEVIEYLNSQGQSTLSIERDDVDQLITKVWSTFSEMKRLEESQICSGMTQQDRQKLEAAIGSARAKITGLNDVIDRSPGISPFSMQRLLNYFEGRTGDPSELIPPTPDSQDAVENYNKILQRINKHMAPICGSSGRAFVLAMLIVHWMQGWSLARLIDARIAYLRRKKKRVEIGPLIRYVMADVEEFARFVAPKYISCYIDVLQVFLSRSGRSDLAAMIPDVGLWLEFGTSQQTQLSLMGLGLTRASAVLLTEFIKEDKLDEQSVLARLKLMDLVSLGLPSSTIREVSELLGQKVIE